MVDAREPYGHGRTMASRVLRGAQSARIWLKKTPTFFVLLLAILGSEGGVKIRWHRSIVCSFRCGLVDCHVHVRIVYQSGRSYWAVCVRPFARRRYAVGRVEQHDIPC